MGHLLGNGCSAHEHGSTGEKTEALLVDRAPDIDICIVQILLERRVN